MFLRYVSRRLNTNENHGKTETDSTQFSSNTNFASFLFFPLFGKIVVRQDWLSIIPLIPNCKPIFSSMLQENCTEVIFSSDPPFKRLDHYKLHEYTRKWNFSSANKEPVTMTLTTSIDAMFKRKRGRPPKNRVIEVRNKYFLNFCPFFRRDQSKKRHLCFE